MQNKMESQAEHLMQSVMLKEERPPISVMEIKSETAVCSDSEAENVMKIKQETLVLDSGLLSEDSATSDTVRMKNDIDEFRILPKIEIKEESCLQEQTSPKVEYHLETLPVSDMCCEVKDETYEDFSAPESTRLHTETAASACSTSSDSFSTAELDEKNCLEQKDDLKLTGVSVHDIYGGERMETCSVEQTLHIGTPKAPCADKQSEKLKKCRSNSNVCELCGERFFQWEAFKAHICCPESEGPNNNENPKTHSLVQQHKKSFQCEVCGKSFTRRGDLKRHIWIHADYRPYRCDLCERSYTHVSSLKNHIMTHQCVRPYKCTICVKSFSQRSYLRLHILAHEGKSPYKCGICVKSFLRQTSLDRHLLFHEGKRVYDCNLCERSFILKADLKRHMRVHEGLRPFKCDLCDNSFTRIASLKKHIMVHKGKRPYKCEVCEKSFTSKSTLRNHIMIHQGKRPHKCNICTKTFTQQYYLKKHIFLHEGKRPYKCDICAKSFTRQSSLNRHLPVHEGKMC